jgi:hypothetical protein
MALAAVLAGVGAGASIIGTLRQGQEQSQTAEYNAKVAQQNSILAQEQASENARRSLIQTNKMIGSQKAGFAASGVSGAGVLDVLQDTASKGELDALTIKNEGDIRANYYNNESALQRARASNALTGSYIGAVGAGINGGSRIAGMGGGGSSGGID